MKKLLKPANIAFYFLMLLLFFVLGLYFASFIEAGKNQGLAGGAIVLGWGVLFGVIAFLASFFIANFTSVKTIIKINWLLLILLVATWSYKYYQFKIRDKEQEEKSKQFHPPPTSPTEAVQTVSLAMLSPYDKSGASENFSSENKNMGIGFFIPNFYEKRTLYFYGGVNLEKGLTDHIPQDSVVFALDQNQNFTTTYAPPWLYPAALKLDYGIIHFKAIGMGRDFIKVETNSQNGQIAYLDKSAGKFVSWPEFILSMNSVEFPEENKQSVRVKPLDYAGEIKADYDFIEPLMVEGEWLYGILLDGNRQEKGKGWIKWQQGGKLLVSYNLFS